MTTPESGARAANRSRGVQTRPRGRLASRRAVGRSVIAHFVLVAGALVMVYPLVWLVSASFRGATQATSDALVMPWQATGANYAAGWNGLLAPFGVFIFNSTVLCILAVAGNVLSCTLAAFAFARLRFALRGVLFALMLATIMLPFHVTLVPQYIFFHQIGWINTLLPLIVPKFLAVDSFFVFLIVQFIRTIPGALDDAATIDGCGSFQLFFRVLLPLLSPALATTAVFSFIWTWNDFLPQLLYLNGVERFTVPVALQAFMENTSSQLPGAMFAMSVVSLVPVFVLFLVFQRFLTEGIATTGLKS